MVLELANICLRSIRDGIEEGRIHGAHLGLLPPCDPKMSLRQRVLDWVLLNGTINNPNCLVALSSVEFLDGMTSLSTLKSRGNDCEYLARLAKTLRATSKYGDKIGSAITGLEVVLVHNVDDQNRCVARVIGECPNLKVLSRRTVCVEHSDLLNLHSLESFGQFWKATEFQSCRKIIAGVNELSILGDYNGSYDDFLAIPFTNLRSLRLYGGFVVVNGETWLALMESVKDTLITLYVDDLCILSVFSDLLPCPMPRLQDLTIVSFIIEYCRFRSGFRLSMDILSKCRELNHLLLPVTENSSEAASAVNSLSNVAVDVKIYLTDDDDDDTRLFLKEPPRFRLVDLFKEKITHVRFAFIDWNIEYAVAFEQFVGHCPNLIGFEYRAWSSGPVDLTALFNNVSRARQLRQVILNGDIIFGNLFQNCLDLDSLRLASNPHVYNDEFIQWAQHGGRLSEMEIEWCDNVDQDGVVALLVASGSKLRKVSLKGWWTDSNSKDRVQQCIALHCPLTETVKITSI